MTPKQKQLLLKDLCGRMPFEPICEYTDVEDGCKVTAKLSYSLRDFITGKVIIKPYLRPMSSMTEEEEKKGLFEAIGKDMDLLEETLDREPLFRYGDNLYYGNPIHYELDFLISHHFDYLGLIPMGLALEATEGMYKI